MNRKLERGDAEVVGAVLTLAFIVGIAVAAIWVSIASSTNHRNETFTIDRSERIAEAKSGRYLLFTDKGVYENTDNMLNNKYNSSDLYAALKVGKKYECDVVGWRNGFFSSYPNVISCTEVKS